MSVHHAHAHSSRAGRIRALAIRCRGHDHTRRLDSSPSHSDTRSPGSVAPGHPVVLKSPRSGKDCPKRKPIGGREGPGAIGSERLGRAPDSSESQADFQGLFWVGLEVLRVGKSDCASRSSPAPRAEPHHGAPATPPAPARCRARVLQRAASSRFETTTRCALLDRSQSAFLMHRQLRGEWAPRLDSGSARRQRQIVVTFVASTGLGVLLAPSDARRSRGRVRTGRAAAPGYSAIRSRARDGRGRETGHREPCAPGAAPEPPACASPSSSPATSTS
jgi:hypothetical protein